MSENNTEASDIKKRIAELREELSELVEEYGLDHHKVLEFSKKLDLLILEML
jgi:hypothetical protein